jgi:hypothetical protein
MLFPMPLPAERTAQRVRSAASPARARFASGGAASHLGVGFSTTGAFRGSNPESTKLFNVLSHAGRTVVTFAERRPPARPKSNRVRRLSVMPETERILLEIKLPVPVKELAAVAEAMTKLHGRGNVYMREAGPMLQLYKTEKP